MRKKIIFVGILKVTDEKSRQDLEPDPHQDPLVKALDPRICIRIQIRNKISHIRNTDGPF